MVNIQPNAAAATVAGTSRAAARGGEADNQATEATRQQSVSEKPAGKAADASAIDAGDQTGDRGGNGRQVYDRFESSRDEEADSRQESKPAKSVSSEGTGEHLDLEA